MEESNDNELYNIFPIGKANDIFLNKPCIKLNGAVIIYSWKLIRNAKYGTLNANLFYKNESRLNKERERTNLFFQREWMAASANEPNFFLHRRMCSIFFSVHQRKSAHHIRPRPSVNIRNRSSYAKQTRNLAVWCQEILKKKNRSSPASLI